MKTYDVLLKDVGALLEEGRKNAVYAVNSILVKTYWEIGKRIVEYEQKGVEKAEYGSALLRKLSVDLKKYKGFSMSNLYSMRLFYQTYPIFQTVSGKLTWSHFLELLMVDEDNKRQFYETECIQQNWSVRELKRQKDSFLFERSLVNKKETILLSDIKNNDALYPEEFIKDPYVLDFLKISENHTEKELEQKIIDNLQRFLLELGKGFSFVGRQYRISFGNKHYYIDLVFYNHLLKCFILIDLKTQAVSNEDIGQMNVYINYFKEEISKDDNPPIGIILSTEKDQLLMKYALGGISNNLFVSKYKLYLPTKKELERELRRWR